MATNHLYTKAETDAVITAILGGVTAGKDSFEILFLSPAISTINWAGTSGGGAFTQSSSRFAAFDRSSGGNQFDEIVVRLPGLLTPGTWNVSLTHEQLTSCGIYTISFGSSATGPWTDIGTVDGYAAATTATRTLLTGIVLTASDSAFARLKINSKNASSSSYAGRVQHLAGVRIS